MRPAVLLGDAVRAALELEADPYTTAAIASLLDLPLATPAETRPAPPVDPVVISRSETQLPRPSEPAPVEQPLVSPQAPGPALDRPAGVVGSTVRRVGTGAPPSESTTIWLSSLAPLSRAGQGDAIDAPEPEPLFTPEWAAALLVEALGVQVSSGPYDIGGMVNLAATAQPLRELRHSRRTLSYGVQLLIDSGPGMAPFAQDCSLLRRDVARLAGGGMQVMRFTGCPTRGAGQGPRPWGQYCPPPSPTPVLIVTDLGVNSAPVAADRAGFDEWIKFTALLQRARCRPIAFVPCPRSRIPQALAAALSVIEWDRSTTVQSVHQVVAR